MEEALIANTTISHYRVLCKLGAGGMGEVYLAEDTRLDRKVAIKFLPPQSVADEQAKKRLIREARAAAKLDHPNICSIYEVAEEDGRSFIVMQYIEGETLDARVKRAPLALSESLAVAAQIADALAEAHSRGIVHRDIKPANVMLTPRGQVKVLDFGLAKLERAEVVFDGEAETKSLLSTPGAIVGTVPYMSPEQVRGEKLDARSDIFSFGVVVYEMLTGHQPFAAQSGAVIISAILTRQPAPLAGQVAGCTEELQRIVSKCLQKDREQRYQTMRDLALDLDNCRREPEAAQATPHDERVTEGDAVAAKTSEVKQSRLLSSRRALMAGAALLALLIAVALIYVLGFRRGATTAHVQEIRSLAVLPLKSLDAGENHLGLGVADAVIRRISQTGQLIVRPTSAVRRYLNEETDALAAARQLEVDAVLEGNVQRAEDRLRVSVNLLRVADGASLWTDSFDTRVADIFTIQDTISQQVASRLQLKLDPAQQARLAKRHTSNPDAYNYYAKAMYHLSNRDWFEKPRGEVDQAIELFKKAIEIDQSYALAHAQLGYAYAWTAITFTAITFEDDTAMIEQAKREIGIAERLDPQLAEVHVARAFIYWSQYEGWQLAAAVRELRLAQQLDPNVGHFEFSDIYIHIGLDEQADKALDRAMEIDPTSTILKQNRVNTKYLTAKPDEGLAADQKYFNRGPISSYYLEKRMLKEAEPLVAQNYQEKPDDLQSRRDRALLLALQGKHQEAEASVPGILEKSRRVRGYHHFTYDIARIYALNGKAEEAVKWLWVTAEAGMPNYSLFSRDSFLERIRQDPAFIQFMAEMKTRWEGYQREFSEGAMQ